MQDLYLQKYGFYKIFHNSKQNNYPHRVNKTF